MTKMFGKIIYTNYSHGVNVANILQRLNYNV